MIYDRLYRTACVGYLKANEAVLTVGCLRWNSMTLYSLWFAYFSDLSFQVINCFSKYEQATARYPKAVRSTVLFLMASHQPFSCSSFNRIVLIIVFQFLSQPITIKVSPLIFSFPFSTHLL